MSFDNLTVDTASLPKAAEVPLTPIDPNYATLGAVVRVGLFGFLLTLAWFLPSQLPEVVPVAKFHGFLVFSLLLVFVAAPVLCFLARRRIFYGLREHDVLLRSGLFVRQLVIQPLVRLQHVSVNQGPLEKQFGLATLRVYSAGSGAATFAIPGLPLATAESLREAVLGYRAET